MSQRFKTPDVMEAVSPNLIPMIDIMFLMLLFFMLGADMSQRDMEDAILTTADMVNEDSRTKDGEERTTVNIHHRDAGKGFSCPIHENHGICRDESHWLTAIRGKEFTRETLNLQLQVEASLDLEPNKDESSGK